VRTPSSAELALLTLQKMAQAQAQAATVVAAGPLAQLLLASEPLPAAAAPPPDEFASLALGPAVGRPILLPQVPLAGSASMLALPLGMLPLPS
jgi:hypothetical protein